MAGPRKPNSKRGPEYEKEIDRLKRENARIAERLREAEGTLEAIRSGHVDALVVQGPAGDQIFTLRGADHRYRQLVETMNEGALLCAADGTIVYCNARFAKLLNVPLERVLGRSLGRFISPRWQSTLDALLRVVEGGTARAEVELDVDGGLPIPVYLSTTPSWDEGDKFVCVIATDLAEQKRALEVVAAEQFAASIIEQAAEGIVVCDLDRRVVRASQAAHAIAGANVLLQPIESALPLALAGGRRLEELVDGALAGAAATGIEAALERPGSETLHLVLSLGPVRSARGTPVGCVLSLVDVTGSKRAAEERLRLLERADEARAVAESASRAKDEFVAMLGHELRNPLAPILTALDLMRLKAPDTFLREREVIERQVTHVVRLVGDLLDVSRITQGKVVLDKRRIELAEAVVRAIEFVSPLIEQRGHQLSLDVAPSGLLVLADATRLTQVVANLLTNAAKYTDPGGRIEVTGVREGDEVVLRVRDNGAGIAPEVLPMLFESFVQSRRTIDRSEGGLGLGLAIVRSLVGLHGGSVGVDSHGVGGGSTFEVRLPALDGSRDVRPARASTPPRSLAAPGEARRVLIVDDNTDAADLLAEALHALGHTTRVAHDGPSALAAAAEFRPDIGLLDIGLPVMDGRELARRLRVEFPESRSLRLVALTGYGQDSDRSHSIAAGFDEHLVKPVDIARLNQLIRDLTAPAAADVN